MWAGTSEFVYGLVCPIAGIVRYVGTTTSPVARFQRHMRRGVSQKVQKWLDALAAQGLRPHMVILEVGPYDRSASLEPKWIAYMRDRHGTRLLNGGYACGDHEYTATIRKMQDAHATRWHASLSREEHDAAEDIRATLGISKKDMARLAMQEFIDKHSGSRNRESDNYFRNPC